MAHDKLPFMARYQVFACEVLFRETAAEAASAPNIIHLTVNRYGLHHVGSTKMAAELQGQIDAVKSADFDAILMVYGLCNNGIVGLTARDIPIIVPRAHDCITLLLGSKERYETEFGKVPGTYYHSPGWLEHAPADEDDSMYTQLGFTKSYAEMVEKYGEENAKYIMETMGNLGSYKETYSRVVYIDTGVGPKESLIQQSRKAAEENGWNFELSPGDRSLIRKMLAGDWDPEAFLVIKPGQTLKQSYDKAIVAAG